MSEVSCDEAKEDMRPVRGRPRSSVCAVVFSSMSCITRARLHTACQAVCKQARGIEDMRRKQVSREVLFHCLL